MYLEVEKSHLFLEHIKFGKINTSVLKLSTAKNPDPAHTV